MLTAAAKNTIFEQVLEHVTTHCCAVMHVLLFKSKKMLLRKQHGLYLVSVSDLKFKIIKDCMDVVWISKAEAFNYDLRLI